MRRRDRSGIAMFPATSRETKMREAPRIEAKTGHGSLSAPISLRMHWPEYLMEAGETGVYLFSACVVATLLWHPQLARAPIPDKRRASPRVDGVDDGGYCACDRAIAVG